MIFDLTATHLALIGGAIIAISACMMMLFFGRITGISGITWQAIQAPKRYGASSMFFLLGIIFGTLGVTAITGIDIKPIESNPFTIIIAGLLVGYGTKLGSGCTSGHGICGISRLSLRSLAATTLFMLSGITTVYVVRHLI